MSFKTLESASQMRLRSRRQCELLYGNLLCNRRHSNPLSAFFSVGSGDYQHGGFPTQLRQPNRIPLGAV